MVYFYCALLFGLGLASQYQAASRWEYAARRPHLASLKIYAQAAFLWGVLGSATLKLCALLLEGPLKSHDLLNWEYLLGYGLVNFGLCLFLGKQLVERPFGAISWLASLVTVSILRTFDLAFNAALSKAQSWSDIPLLFEELAPLHVVSVIFYALIFYGLLRVGSTFLAYPTSRAPQAHIGLWSIRLNSRTQFIGFVFLADFLLLGIDRCMIQMSVNEGIPGSFYAIQWTLASWGTAALIYAFLASAHNRRFLSELKEKSIWQNVPSNSAAYGEQEIENTMLMGKALKQLNVSLFLWKHPVSNKAPSARTLMQGIFHVTTGAPYGDTGGSAHSLYVLLEQSLHPQDKKEFFKAIDKCLAGEQKTEVIARFKGEDRTWRIYRVQISYELMNSPYGDFHVVYGSQQEITQQVLESEYLSDTNVRQLNALRMIGHDLATPLSVIAMSNAILKTQTEHTKLNEVAQRALNRIGQACEQGLEYLERTLQYARSTSKESNLEVERVNFHELIDQAVGTQADKFGFDTNRVHVKVDTFLKSARLFRFPLELILNNLISNAMKYSPNPNTPIHITVSLIEQQLEHCIQIEVCDEGLGIPEDQQGKLFCDFERADNVQNISGTGLGLGIVRNAVQMMQASIEVLSQPTRKVGTCVRVKIPLTTPEIDRTGEFHKPTAS